MLFNDVLSTHYRERLEPGRSTGTGWLVDELACSYHKLTQEASRFDRGVKEQTGISPRHPVSKSPCWEPMNTWCDRWEDWSCIDGILGTELLKQFPELLSLHPNRPQPECWPKVPQYQQDTLNCFKEQLTYLADCYAAAVLDIRGACTNPQSAMAAVLKRHGLDAPLVLWLHLFDEVDILGELDLCLVPPTEKWLNLNALWAEYNDEAPIDDN